MDTLTVSKARANFSRISRAVISKRKPVVVKTPTGLVQIAPYDSARSVPPAKRGSIKMTKREIELANSLGDSL